jgi:putative nucleotidyltransferase with HDIG domain
MAFELFNHTDGQVVPLSSDASLTIGRGGQTEIQVTDQSVSRRHCRVEVVGGRVRVVDLQSANGTFVNERAVQSADLQPGDLLRIGSTVFECRTTGAPASGVHRPVLGGDASTIESVISRRIEPTQFSWLEAPGLAARELDLLRRAQRHLTTLHRVSEHLAGARETRSLCDAVLAAVLEVTGADRGALLLKRPEDGVVELIASRVAHATVASFTVSRTLVADVVEKGLSTFAHDAEADQRYRTGQSVVLQHVRSVMCVPLRTADEILGALYVDSLSGPGRFSDADLELLAAVGNQAGLALHRVRLLGELEQLFLDTIRAIAATVDAKDGYTHRHSERVAAFARRIAAELGRSEEEQELVEWAALLHDVGKIAVPDSILNKRDRLDTDEYAAMKEHPAHGARILANIQSRAVRDFLPGVRAHHERWDGAGYPDGLKGDDIPLFGRIVAAADFLDALTSARSYRPAEPLERALERLQEGSGSHFDPTIVRAVFALHERGELTV